MCNTEKEKRAIKLFYLHRIILIPSISLFPQKNMYIYIRENDLFKARLISIKWRSYLNRLDFVLLHEVSSWNIP